MRSRNPLALALGISLVLSLFFCALAVYALLAERQRIAQMVEEDESLVAMLDTLDQALDAGVRRQIGEHVAAVRQAYEARIAAYEEQLAATRQAYESRIALLQLQGGRNDEACFARLDGLGVEYRRVGNFDDGRCSKTNAVRVDHFGQAQLSSPADMTCRMAEMFAIYERDVLQPLADELFRTQVTRVDHVGTYNCRNVAGTAVLSQHGHANAIDISGFALADGQTFSVLDDWRTSSPGAEFMRRASYGGCTIFSVALTPQFNEAHANHIHLDAGATKACH